MIDTKNKLFSIIAHDLRGPVGNFLPVLDLLTSGKKVEEGARIMYLEQLKKSSKNTFYLLENLLSWAQSQSGAIMLKPAGFLINDLLSGTIEVLSSLADAKQIEVVTISGGAVPVWADIDSVKLVIRNLLSNAIKFTPSNGRIAITTRDIGRVVEIEIADNGVGMSGERVNALFTGTSFHSTYGTNNEAGSGIGLVLCKDFIEKNGGEIRVESVEGGGSAFIFTLPKVTEELTD